MKTSNSFPILCACLAFLVSAVGARAQAPFQFALFAPSLQVVPENESVSGLRLSVLYGRNADVAGLDLGVVNTTNGDFRGVGFGPVQLVVGDASAWQAAWFYARTSGRFTGWQGGVLAHVQGGSAAGLQTGFISLADEDFEGVQVGFFNRADTVRGVQLGFINWAERLDGGLQIGLVNRALNSDLYPVLPVVNWSF
jgi:hypothetical protein